MVSFLTSYHNHSSNECLTWMVRDNIRVQAKCEQVRIMYVFCWPLTTTRAPCLKLSPMSPWLLMMESVSKSSSSFCSDGGGGKEGERKKNKGMKTNTGNLEATEVIDYTCNFLKTQWEPLSNSTHHTPQREPQCLCSQLQRYTNNP